MGPPPAAGARGSRLREEAAGEPAPPAFGDGPSTGRRSPAQQPRRRAHSRSLSPGRPSCRWCSPWPAARGLLRGGWWWRQWARADRGARGMPALRHPRSASAAAERSLTLALGCCCGGSGHEHEGRRERQHERRPPGSGLHISERVRGRQQAHLGQERPLELLPTAFEFSHAPSAAQRDALWGGCRTCKSSRMDVLGCESCGKQCGGRQPCSSVDLGLCPRRERTGPRVTPAPNAGGGAEEGSDGWTATGVQCCSGSQAPRGPQLA